MIGHLIRKINKPVTLGLFLACLFCNFWVKVLASSSGINHKTERRDGSVGSSTRDRSPFVNIHNPLLQAFFSFRFRPRGSSFLNLSSGIGRTNFYSGLLFIIFSPLSRYGELRYAFFVNWKKKLFSNFFFLYCYELHSFAKEHRRRTLVRIIQECIQT